MKGMNYGVEMSPNQARSRGVGGRLICSPQLPMIVGVMESRQCLCSQDQLWNWWCLRLTPAYSDAGGFPLPTTTTSALTYAPAGSFTNSGPIGISSVN